MSEYNVAELKSSLGIVKLLKGTRLYYYGYNWFNSNFTLSEKLFLRTYLHPSDHPCKRNNEIITVIELLKDITLLFMIHSINYSIIVTYLNNYIDFLNINLPEKKRNLTDKKLINAWQNEGIDGWLSSIKNNDIDVVIFNDPSIYKIIETKPILFDWSNDIIKKWGIIYPVYIIQYPTEMILNSKYKSQIDNYKQFIENNNPDGTTLALLLKYSNIIYIDK